MRYKTDGLSVRVRTNETCNVLMPQCFNQSARIYYDQAWGGFGHEIDDNNRVV